MPQRRLAQVLPLRPAAAAHGAPDVALAERLFAELRANTGDGGGITRASYGPGEGFAHDLMRREALALGLDVRTDAASNLYITLPGRSGEGALMIGSHLDSVPCGGNFDGAAGVLMGLAVLSGYRRAGIVPPRDITVMVIRAEESAWFNASYIGSRAAFGLLDPAELDDVVRSDDGRCLGDHIRAVGGDPDALRRRDAFLDPSRIGLFIEPHIEQGPYLIASDAPAGIVTGIRGSFRHRRAACIGAYAHSGATPRALRHDAVSAVAALVVGLNDLWRRLEEAGEDLTITVGQIATDPAEHAFSKVAGRVDFCLDVRSQSVDTLRSVRASLYGLAAQIAAEFRVGFDFGPLTDSSPAVMDAAVVAGLAGTAEALGIAAPCMACGAGHDAAVFANAGIPTGMLFIRNANGSHNPDESMDMADFAAAAAILSRFCLACEGPRP